MKNYVHLIFKKNASTVVPAINQNLDNIEASFSLSIQEFLYKSENNKYYPKRILLISGNAVEEDQLRELYFYLRENSENTEVVLICNYKVEDGELKDKEAIRNFKDLFQESIYQVAYATRWNIKTLMQTVSSSLPELDERARIFESENNISFTESEGRFISGKTEDVLVEEESEEVPEVAGFESDRVAEPEAENGVRPNPWNIYPEPKEREPEVAESEGEGAFQKEQEDDTWGSIEINETPDIFSLGEIGGMHVETGFLDEDEEEEEEEETEEDTEPYVNQPEWVPEDYHPYNPTPVKPELRVKKNYFEESVTNTEPPHEVEPAVIEGRNDFQTTVYEEPQNRLQVAEPRFRETAPVNNLGYKLEFNSSDGVLNLITGTRDVDTSNHVIELAMQSLDRGEKVLIVDLDFNYHNILSNIDIQKFNRSQQNGLGGYEEDGLIFISGGYGKTKDQVFEEILKLIEFLKKRNSFNKIFLDCPMDSLDGEIFRHLKGVKITLLVKGEYQSFVRTYIAAEEVPYEFAENYFYNGDVTIINENADWRNDLNELRGNTIPGRVDWLNDAYIGN